MQNVKILIIEDETMIASMYKTKLEQDGATVELADNGVDALKILKNNDFDLILLDIILPKMDGFQILEEIKKDKKTEKIPVVMLTNLSTEEDRKKGEEKGADDYWVKARFTPSQISAKVKEFLKI